MKTSTKRPRYLTLDTARRYVDPPIPDRTIRGWIDSGRLPASRPGRRVLVREDHLIAYLEGRDPRAEVAR